MQNKKKIHSTTELRYFGILEHLVKAGSEGISHKDLANKLKIDRDSLRRYMPSLLNSRIVKRKGKKGNYYMSKIVSSNNFLKGMILHKKFVNQLLGKEDIILFQRFMVFHSTSNTISIGLIDEKKIENDENETEFGDYFNSQDFYLKYFKPLFNKDSELEKKLFEFINQIGAYIVFILMLVISRKNDINSLDKDDIEFLDGALNKFTGQIYYNFINRFLLTFSHEEQKKGIDKYKMENKFEKNELLEKKIMLEKGFNNIYPYISYKLNKLTEDLQEDLEYDKDMVKKGFFKSVRKG